MRNVVSLMIGAVLLFSDLPARAATAPNAGMPLYVAFKAFCLDTGARRGAVKRAVEAVGGVPHHPSGGPTASDPLPNGPLPEPLAAWDVVIDGRAMTVYADADRSARGMQNSVTSGFDSCTIDSDADEDASVAALRAWTGVPTQFEAVITRDANGAPELTQSHFEFQKVGSAHRAIADAVERRSVKATGRYWTFDLARSPQTVSVNLMHVLPNSAH